MRLHGEGFTRTAKGARVARAPSYALAGRRRSEPPIVSGSLWAYVKPYVWVLLAVRMMFPDIVAVPPVSTMCRLPPIVRLVIVV
jgi:hypothetical protein